MTFPKSLFCIYCRCLVHLLIVVIHLMLSLSLSFKLMPLSSICCSNNFAFKKVFDLNKKKIKNTCFLSNRIKIKKTRFIWGLGKSESDTTRWRELGNQSFKTGKDLKALEHYSLVKLKWCSNMVSDWPAILNTVEAA